AGGSPCWSTLWELRRDRPTSAPTSDGVRPGATAMRLREFASLLGPLHPDGPSDRLARCHNIEDLRAEARRFLPRAVFDFVDGGAEEEITLRRNRAAFEEFELVPRVMQGAGEVDLTTEMLGCASP